jgi:RES domain-containing protein
VIYSREILNFLERLEARPFAETVHRHMFGDYPPERENVDGARWNPPGVHAIYAALSRDGALAESEYQISLQPNPPRAKRTLYAIAVELASVIDFSSRTLLQDLGIGDDELGSLDLGPCQMVGGAVEWLGHDGLLVPSARHGGTNLVVFPRHTGQTYRFETVNTELIDRGSL